MVTTVSVIALDVDGTAACTCAGIVKNCQDGKGVAFRKTTLVFHLPRVCKIATKTCQDWSGLASMVSLTNQRSSVISPSRKKSVCPLVVHFWNFNGRTLDVSIALPKPQ